MPTQPFTFTFPGNDDEMTYFSLFRPTAAQRLFLAGGALAAFASVAHAQSGGTGAPIATPHTQQAYDPEGNFTMRAPCEINGSVVVTGNMTLQGSGDFATINFDADALESLMRNFGAYRRVNSIYLPRRNR